MKNSKDTIDQIGAINENNNACKWIRLYIYKRIYNNDKIDFFLGENNIRDYK